MTRIMTGVSYFGNRNPRHYEVDLQEILSHHCNFVLHTFSENDQLFYKDTVAQMVSLSKEAGLECYLDPWGVGRVFGGESFSSFALKNIDACQILPDGKIAPAVCLNHPVFLEFMRNWIDDAADVGADVVFWDEPHFYIELKERSRYPVWHCRCTTCVRLFQDQHGMEITAAEERSIIKFKEDSVVTFLQELCDYTTSKGMKNAVCLLPFKNDQIGISDWSRVAAIPNVQTFGTDPYWMFFNENLESFVGEFSEEVVQTCRTFHKEPQIWIQAYKITAGREKELKRAISVAHAKGVRNFAAWSYYGNAYMSYNRSDNPQKVWDIIGEAYAALHRGDLE